MTQAKEFEYQTSIEDLPPEAVPSQGSAAPDISVAVLVLVAVAVCWQYDIYLDAAYDAWLFATIDSTILWYLPVSKSINHIICAQIPH